MLSALDLAQVRAFDADPIGEGFLRHTLRQSRGAHSSAEGPGRHFIVGGGTRRAAALDGTLLHEPKRRLEVDV